MLRKRDPEELKPYLNDASNLRGGCADEVLFPENENEVADLLREANSKKIPVTVSGKGTGLAGGRVPLGGWVLATDRLNKVVSIQTEVPQEPQIVTQPGVCLQDLQAAANVNHLFYPAIPTSILSFIGGNIATNASGPQSFKYGPARRYVRGLRLVTADGGVIRLKRGQIKAKKGVFEIPCQTGSKTAVLRIPVPAYKIPKVKHAGGYYCADEMDAIDLFIGTEGTLAVFTEIQLKVLPLPRKVFNFIVFFKREEDAWDFAAEAVMLSRSNVRMRNDAGLSARAMEYMDGPSLDLIRGHYPDIPGQTAAAVYLEQECQGQTEQLLLEQYYLLFEKYSAIIEDPWFADTPEGDEKFRAFRHQIPLEVRDLLKREGRKKIGTDFAVPFDKFKELMLYQRKRLQELDLPAVTFGHLGDAHVHLNILAKNDAQSEQGWKLYQEMVERVIRMNGSICAEHGVGKIKPPYLEQMLGKEAMEQMLLIKKTLDPNGILGRGTLFPADSFN